MLVTIVTPTPKRKSSRHKNVFRYLFYVEEEENFIIIEDNIPQQNSIF